VEIPYTVLSGSDLNLIKELILVLKPLEFMTKQVSGENYATASIVIPLLFCSSQQLQNIKISFRAQEIQDVLVVELKVEQCRPIALATLLDPRFKNRQKPTPPQARQRKAWASIVIPLLFCCSQQLQNIKISVRVKEIKDVLVAERKRRFGNVEQCLPNRLCDIVRPKI